MRLQTWILILGCVTMNVTVTTTVTDDAPISDSEASAIIDRLLSLPHGLHLAPPEVHDLVTIMGENPDVFEPLLAARLEWLASGFSQQLGEHEIGRSIGALSLSAALGPERASKLANATLRAGLRNVDESRTMLVPSEDGVASQRDAIILGLQRLCGVALKMLTDFENAEAVDDVVGRLPGAEIGLRTDMLRYLSRVAPLRPDIRPRLEEMYHSPDSPLRNNPQLLRVLEAMDAAETDGRPDKNDAESRPEGKRKP